MIMLDGATKKSEAESAQPEKELPGKESDPPF